MYAQVDLADHAHGILDSNIDFKKYDKAMSKDDPYVTTKSGRCRMRETKSGWNFIYQFKEVSELWMPPKRLKESNPFELAESVTAKGIAEEPVF